jgi:hypothetical protein
MGPGERWEGWNDEGHETHFLEERDRDGYERTPEDAGAGDWEAEAQWPEP